MRSNWIRAWLATAGVLVAAIAFVRTRLDWVLNVEQPVMDWVLDGTDTSRWDQVGFLSDARLLIVGTLLMVIIGAVLEWRIAIAVVVTTVIGTVLTQLVQSLVSRQPPSPNAVTTSSFPSTELVQTGVFCGLVVLMLWWLKLPRLPWQIIVEVAIVLTLVVALRLILSGEIWPSDAVGSAIVITLSLITAALVFEANPARFPWRRKGNSTEAAVGSSSA